MYVARAVTLTLAVTCRAGMQQVVRVESVVQTGGMWACICTAGSGACHEICQQHSGSSRSQGRPGLHSKLPSAGTALQLACHREWLPRGHVTIICSDVLSLAVHCREARFPLPAACCPLPRAQAEAL